ncbi:hypothetical protein PMG11_03194 [Penicillium brasilianum]|uniref:Jacalin-type lectin domain-containing protein n=1 Tax=Penicillium brasilianum TaxID=104259 RepID=A0A0F7VEW4_PENBI|nr:hypothetical protein PMG11_03194 [Penicillium brasilianum]
MAQLLAPYNNSMRLGQGFNSYTQQTCLDQAVLPDPTLEQSDALRRKAAAEIQASPISSSTPTSSASSTPTSSGAGTDSAAPESKQIEDAPAVSTPGTDVDIIGKARREALSGPKQDPKSGTGMTVPPWVKPQIVTYSSRFVDKLSDVTDAMNISGSLSIKTATIGGKANGSYVDSDKFKSSDINFHLQVKVTNQVVEPGNYCIFNKIPHIPTEKFNEVYGDSFISGWESGGELNAIISMKIADKSKVFEIKASLEAELTTPGISGAVKGSFEQTKNKISSDTETTIAVNWSGGGRIKDPTEDWSIASLKKAAAAFPDLVAITPQRTYAILTKYTALESFHLQVHGFSPLDYENAGVYTGSLLDNYMDYKALWKQISFASYELENNRATIDMAQPSQDVYELAKVKTPMLSSKRKAQKLLKGSTNASLALATQETDASASPNDPKESEAEKSIPVFPASFAGLIQARKVCRMEMAKIVNEVDAVAEDPSVASDATRDEYFLNPLVFKQLIPVVRSQSAENAIYGVRDPSATIILGYSPPAHDTSTALPVYKLNASIDKQDHRLQASIRKCAAKAEDYRMHGTAGAVEQVHENADMFNALERLDPTFRPTAIAVWAPDNVVQGIQMTYSRDKISFGECNEKVAPSHKLDLKHDGSEVVVEIEIKTGVDESGDKYIAAISLGTSTCNTLNTFTGNEADAASLQTIRYVRHDDQLWSLRGFFGFAHKKRLISLGIVWGKDSFVPVPNSPLSPPLCRNLLGMSQAMQKDLLGHMVSLKNKSKYMLGHFVHTGIRSEKSQIFNALSDIDSTYTIAKLGFATATTEQGKSGLSGLKVFYTNGKSLIYGAYPKKDEEASWVCDVDSQIVTAKLVAAKTTGDKQEKSQTSFIDSVELILAANNLGQLPGWPLDVATVRFLSNEEDKTSSDYSTLVESAPKPGRAIWSMKGFYGEHTDGLITQLGIVWGCS